MRISDWSSDVCSSDLAEAGAVVVQEPLRGKGNVVRRMFADIEADIYVLADGDDTYDAAAAPGLIETLCREQPDMVNAARNNTSQEAYPRGPRFGHRLFPRPAVGRAAWRESVGQAGWVSG